MAETPSAGRTAGPMARLTVCAAAAANDTLPSAKYWRRERRTLVMGRQIVAAQIDEARDGPAVLSIVNVSGESKS
jgi:hypothetical protein